MASSFVERRKQRPHQDWFTWNTCWLMHLKMLQDNLFIEKKMKDKRGRYKHPRVIGRLKFSISTMQSLKEDARFMAKMFALEAKGVFMAPPPEPTKPIQKLCPNPCKEILIDTRLGPGNRPEKKPVS